jgi:Ala-tRNA(Pro) deacylase
MAIAERLREYLEQHSVTYETLAHTYTPSSARTAEAAHVPGGRLAKGVVLKRPDETFMLMALPADYMVHLGHLHRLLHEEVCLATEQELLDLFPDCAEGAIPALGPAYGLRTLVDRSLFEQEEVFVEAGDHQTLLRLDRRQFEQLLGQAERVDTVRHI